MCRADRCPRQTRPLLRAGQVTGGGGPSPALGPCPGPAFPPGRERRSESSKHAVAGAVAFPKRCLGAVRVASACAGGGLLPGGPRRSRLTVGTVLGVSRPSVPPEPWGFAFGRTRLPSACPLSSSHGLRSSRYSRRSRVHGEKCAGFRFGSRFLERSKVRSALSSKRADRKKVSSTFAPRKSAPRRVARSKCADCSAAPRKDAPSKTALFNFVDTRLAPSKHALWACALCSRASLKSAFSRCASLSWTL